MTCEYELKHLKKLKLLFLETNLIQGQVTLAKEGEGGDYVTENENRHLKSHLSPSVPSLKNWQEAARNHNILTKNREMLFKRLSITDPSSEDSSTFRFDNEISMVRSLICQSTLLSSPRLEKDIMALDGTILHADLVNFYFTAKENYHSYLKNGTDPLPVFINDEEEKGFNNALNWSVSKLKTKLLTLINNFSSNEKADMYKSIFDSYKNASKKRYAELYNDDSEGFDTEGEVE